VRRAVWVFQKYEGYVACNGAMTDEIEDVHLFFELACEIGQGGPSRFGQVYRLDVPERRLGGSALHVHLDVSEPLPSSRVLAEVGGSRDDDQRAGRLLRVPGDHAEVGTAQVAGKQDTVARGYRMIGRWVAQQLPPDAVQGRWGFKVDPHVDRPALCAGAALT